MISKVLILISKIIMTYQAAAKDLAMYDLTGIGGPAVNGFIGTMGLNDDGVPVMKNTRVYTGHKGGWKPCKVTPDVIKGLLPPRPKSWIKKKSPRQGLQRSGHTRACRTILGHSGTY